MKSPLILLAAAFLTPITATAKDGKHLFILSGQSNMAGLDPKVSFMPTVEAALGKENCIIVKDAHGGQPILRWYKKSEPSSRDKPVQIGDLYDRLMTKVNGAVKGTKIETVSFIWMQGESDAKDGYQDVYQNRLQGLIDQLRTDLKRKEIIAVIGRISDLDNGKPGWDKVRQAQVSVAESNPFFAWVDTDDLNNYPDKDPSRNHLHYTKEGYKTLGERFATEALRKIRK